MKCGEFYKNCVLKAFLAGACLGTFACMGVSRPRPYSISVKTGDSLEAARDALQVASFREDRPADEKNDKGIGGGL